MPRVRTKKFRVAEEYHLYAVDCWWAELLQGGLKEIVSIEWEALGQMEWRLTMGWLPVPGGAKLNVGHPQYADVSVEDLDFIMQELLADFESGLHEYSLIEEKVRQWGVSSSPDGKGDEKITFREDLDEVEKIIATDFLWGTYTGLQRWLRQQRTKLRELSRERDIRQASDYYPVMVDRGMLRQAFETQIGYENEWLFDDAAEFDIPSDE